MQVPWEKLSRLVSLICLCTVVAPATVGADQWLYFAATDLMRVRMDGTHLETVARWLPFCGFLSMRVDRRTGQLYFVETCTQASSTVIDRWDRSAGRQQVFSVGAFRAIGGIAVDSVGEAVYFGFGAGAGEIHRKFMRTGVWEVVVRSAGHHILGVAVDQPAVKLYWTSSDDVTPPVGRIRRANLDGTNVEDFVVGLERPLELVIDSSGGEIYWVDDSRKKIQRADLRDGHNVEDVVSGGIGSALGLALDVQAGKIYWSDTGRIRRANLDGSNTEDVVTGVTAGAIELGPDDTVSVQPTSWSRVKEFFK